MIPENQIIQGAMPEATKVFPDGHFNCSISSPPYWALRDYGVDGQLGLEPTFEEYIDKLCTIYDEVKRILRDDGCCFVNLGDTYAGSGMGRNGDGSLGVLNSEKQQSNIGANFGRQGKTSIVSDRSHSGRNYDKTLPAKSLCLIPQRFAIEMVNRGWILRNVIIWHKPNPMPSSAKDRFTVDFEYVFFFVKSKKYWFEPQYEPHKEISLKRIEYGLHHKHPDNIGIGIPPVDTDKMGDRFCNPLGRNKRTVWTIPTQPYPEAHFATFPEKLVEPMIKAGCPEFVCTKCGKGREKIYEPNKGGTIGHDWAAGSKAISGGLIKGNAKVQTSDDYKTYERGNFKGYTDCGCNAEWRPGIVLDCFLWQWDDFTGSCKAVA